MDSLSLTDSHQNHTRCEFLVVLLDHLDVLVQWQSEYEDARVMIIEGFITERHKLTTDRQRIGPCHLADTCQERWADKQH